MAHELGHGAFNLRHPFSPEGFVAAQMATNNLMDYRDGTHLWVNQWRSIQNPERVWLSALEGEEEGEAPYEKNWIESDQVRMGGQQAIIDYMIGIVTTDKEKTEEFLLGCQSLFKVTKPNSTDKQNSIDVLERLMGHQIKVGSGDEAYMIVSVLLTAIVENVMGQVFDELQSESEMNDTDVMDAVKLIANMTGIVVETLPFIIPAFEDYVAFQQAKYLDRLVVVSSTQSNEQLVVNIAEQLDKLSNQRQKSFFRQVGGIPDGKELQQIMKKGSERTNAIMKMIEMPNFEYKASRHLGLSLEKQASKMTWKLKIAPFLFKGIQIFGPVMDMQQIVMGDVDPASATTTLMSYVGVSQSALLTTGWLLTLAATQQMIDHMVKNFMEDVNDDIFQYLMTWEMLTNRPEYHNIWLIYTQEVGLKSSVIPAPTSIRITSSNLASKVFGFTPQNILYNKPNSGSGNSISIDLYYYTPYQ